MCRYVFCWSFLSVFVTTSYAIWPFNKYRVLDADSDLSHQNAPVLLRRGVHGFDLAAPNHVSVVDRLFRGRHRTAVIRLPYQAQLYAACPGNGNFLTGHRERPKFAVYRRQDKCDQPVTPTIRPSGHPCGDGAARMYDIGYTITPEPEQSTGRYSLCRLMCPLNHPEYQSDDKDWEAKFNRLYSCCFDSSSVRTLYSSHVVQGDKIGSSTSTEAEPRYIIGQTSLYPPGFHVNTTYELTHQKEILRKLVGPINSDFLLSNNHLSRGHLAAEADFPMTTWRATASSYLNLVPRWRSVDLGNWRKLEDKVRRLADISESSLIVSTGTLGVMTVQDESNTTRKLFLDPDRDLLPVPQFHWKVVYSPKNSSCIAFVVCNNPWEGESVDLPCSDICQDHGWEDDAWTNTRQGRLVCCTVEELRKAVPYMP